jgi:uncharacterized delta-60 repeat protein
MARQPDGKLVIGRLSGNLLQQEIRVNRLLADGSLDSSFTPCQFGFTPNPYPPTQGVSLNGLALWADGRVLLYGSGLSPSGLVLLVPDGTRVAYNSQVGSTIVYGPMPQSYPASINSAMAQADGKLIISGRFSVPVNNNPYNNNMSLARLQADGSLDPSFQAQPNVGGGPVIALLFDGGLLANAQRLNANGVLDPFWTVLSPQPLASVRALLQQPDGKVVLGGDPPSPGLNSTNRSIVRLLGYDVAPQAPSRLGGLTPISSLWKVHRPG